MVKGEKVVVMPEENGKEVITKVEEVTTKKKEQIVNRFVLKEVATQTDIVIVDEESNKILTQAEAIVELLNYVRKLDKTING
jgi:ribosomal protein S8